MTDLATLYVVATPLGHLGDLSPRAAEILRSVGVVAAEDTRRTRQLLSHLGTSPRLISYHAHSDPGRLDTILAILAEGRDVALVSDAGTPGISDPGAALVRAVWDAGGRVVPIPGPSAVATALSASGFSADRFLFLGFVARKGAERQRLLWIAVESEWTVVLYEAANRVVDLLTDLIALTAPDRQGAVARELTKIYEEIRRGTLSELADYYTGVEPRGEVTVVIEGVARRDEGVSADDLTGGRMLAAELLADGATAKDAVRALMKQLGLPRNVAYRLVMEAR